MAQITSGLVRFEQTKKITEYEPKKAIVEFTFSVGEGEDYATIFSKAQSECMAQVERMLTGKAPVARKPAAEAPAAPADPVTTPKVLTKEAVAAAMNAKDKAKQAIQTGEARVDPAADDWDTPAPETAKEVSDVELSDACSKKCSALKAKGNPQAHLAVKDLIKAVGSTGGASGIPQAKRQEFLTKLEALK